jgi:hypothetical protein
MIRQAAARSNKQICEAVRYWAAPWGRASWLYRNVVRLPFDSGCAYQSWADVMGHISAPEASRSRTGVDGLKVSQRRCCSDVPSSPLAWANPSAQAGVCRNIGGPSLGIPQRGGLKTPQRQAYERSAAFKQGRRFRAGIEGRISVLMRGRGIKRCRAEGLERFALFVGAAVLANNLMILARSLTKRSSRRGKDAQ